MQTQQNYNDMTDEAFRSLVRDFVTAHFPPELLHVGRRVFPFEVADFTRKLAERGWSAPAWPVEWGGMELTVAKYIVFSDVMGEIGLPRIHDMGVTMLGPLLMSFGSQEQKAHFLPRILSREHVWCQGYSEPGAGSDLASLRMPAVRDGDDYVLNGQKIWTTLAHHSNMIFVLARTGAESGKRQDGISFFLLELSTPGITVRPIRTLSDDEEFCEVFFDDVRVPASRMLGEPGTAWTKAKALLGHERLFIGSPRYIRSSYHRVEQIYRAKPRDAAATERFLRAKLDYEDFLCLYADYADMVAKGGKLGAEASVLKQVSARQHQSLSEEMLTLSGSDGVLSQIDGRQADPSAFFFGSRPTTIAGGTTQIQQNILAKAVLGLPG